MKPLAEQCVVITGSGSGLGAAYARHAASLGACILVNDVNPVAAQATAEAIEAEGGRAAALVGDVSDWNFAEQLVDRCVETFGTITGLVNNASILRPARLEDVAAADLRRMLEINVLGTAACAQAAIRRLREIGRGGSIINVASGSHAGDIALGGYAASKGAIASLTYSWAMELRDSGIRMNAISPLAETAMAAQNAHLMALQSAGREVHYAALPPAETNAPLVSFLPSNAADGIHGQIVRIAGRQLSFVSHPMIANPVLEDEWTFEKIQTAFSQTLADHQHKLGLAVAEPGQ